MEGRTTARESVPVSSVDNADVLKTLDSCNKTISDMIRIQMLAGMRPQEVRLMRSSDIDRNDPDIWVYIPRRHKTQHKKKYRTIPIVPECQQILVPYLIEKAETPDDYLFSPADAVLLLNLDRRRCGKKERKREKVWRTTA
jgi:integrase